MPSKLWFGNALHQQWVPMPKTGMTRTMEGLSSEIAFDNGGLWIDDTAAEHAVYNMEFPVSDKGYEGIEAFERFRRGDWGRVGGAGGLGRLGYLRFVDPMYQRDNLFSSSWASPAVAQGSDWKPIYDTTPTFVDFTPGSYWYPFRAAVYTIATSDVPVKANSRQSFIIPPGHKLCLGATGSVTGAGTIRARYYNASGSPSGTVSIPPTGSSAPPSFSVEIPASTSQFVEVYLTRSSSTASTVTLAALRAQIIPIGETPQADRHKPGMGHMGLKFREGSRVDTYIQATRKLVSASLVLAEVESWAP